MRVMALCVVGFVLAFVAFAAEKKINVSDLPQAVQEALKNQTGGGTILGASTEVEHGKTLYEVETKVNGKGRDLTFSDDGTLQEVEQEVDLDRIPALARQALQKAAANGTIKKVEAVTENGTTAYEGEITTTSGKSKEVAVNADGSPHKSD